MIAEPKLHCRYYKGDKPCKFNRTCRTCDKFSPMGTRVLILKMGAMGDALRTTPILHAVKRAYPLNYISWVTDKTSYPILQGNQYIDKLYVIDTTDPWIVQAQSFDLLLSLDKAPVSTALAMLVKAHIRRGYAMSPWGTLDIFNDSSGYALNLGLDDRLKFFINNKTYQETIYQIAEFPYQNDPYIFFLPDTAVQAAKQVLSTLSPRGSGLKIGLNTGCGDVFETKKWPDKHFYRLAELLYKELDARVYLLGGLKESERNKELQEKTHNVAVDTGVHELRVFAGLLSEMDLIVTGDTMALHLALAVKTKVVGLFGPTCHQEIDFYGLGMPLIAKADCAPCYRKKCLFEESCMATILPEHVLDAAGSVIAEEHTH